jgi:hypothetical protein
LNCGVQYTIFCRSFTLCFWPDSEPTKLLHHPKQMTSKDDIKGLVSLSSFVHGRGSSIITKPRPRLAPFTVLYNDNPWMMQQRFRETVPLLGNSHCFCAVWAKFLHDLCPRPSWRVMHNSFCFGRLSQIKRQCHEKWVH